MAQALALPGHVANGMVETIGQPHNLEAEQALLGSLLFENSAFVNVDGLVTADDFYEPFHARLFALISQLVRHGRLAEPILMNSAFALDPAFKDLGGIRYLADLVDRSPPSVLAPEFARKVRSLSLRRDVIRICSDVAQRAAMDDQAEGHDLMAQMEREVLATRQSTGDLVLRPWAEVSREVVFGLDKPDENPLIKTGLGKIDNALGGMERSDLVVIGARPSMGKSALAGCIAMSVARADFATVEVNGEMTTAQMTRRHLADRAFDLFGDQGPTYRAIKRRELSSHQMEMLRAVHADLEQMPLQMVKRTGLTMAMLRATLRRQRMLFEASGKRLTLVVVDHVGLIKPDDWSGSRTADQTAISAGLKEIADELDCVVMALAQLNRKVEDRDDKRPQLADLRDSGSWEQDADVVMGVYRDAYYARREREPKGDVKVAEWVLRCGSQVVEAIMLKIRESDVATAKLWADIGRNAIRDEEPESMRTAFDFGAHPLPN